MATLSGVVGTTVVVSSPNGISYPGYVFTGWNTLANATGLTYAVGSQFTLTGATTFFAQWSRTTVTQRPSLLIGSIGPFPQNSTNVTTVLVSQIRTLALQMRSKGFVKIGLYGYDSGPGTSAHHQTLSMQRAVRVVEYLRADLARLHVKGIKMSARGEGEVTGFTARMFSRVEIIAN